jgi:hypothetical protein
MKKSNKSNLTIISLSVKIIITLVAGCILLISKFAFVFFTISMLPSITSIFIDNRANKCASSTLCGFNLIGIGPYIFNIFNSSNVNETAKVLLTDIYVWAVIYGCAALGCITIWAIPQLMARIFQTKALYRINKINQEQQELKETWGEEVEIRANL